MANGKVIAVGALALAGALLLPRLFKKAEAAPPGGGPPAPGEPQFSGGFSIRTIKLPSGAVQNRPATITFSGSAKNTGGVTLRSAVRLTSIVGDTRARDASTNFVDIAPGATRSFQVSVEVDPVQPTGEIRAEADLFRFDTDVNLGIDVPVLMKTLRSDSLGQVVTGAPDVVFEGSFSV